MNRFQTFKQRVSCIKSIAFKIYGLNRGGTNMVSILTSVTMVSITTYFMMGLLFLATEKWSKVKNRTVIMSFICWSVGRLVFLYTSSYASTHGLMGASAITESIFSVLSLVLLGKVYIFNDEKKAKVYHINKA